MRFPRKCLADCESQWLSLSDESELKIIFAYLGWMAHQRSLTNKNIRDNNICVERLTRYVPSERRHWSSLQFIPKNAAMQFWFFWESSIPFIAFLLPEPLSTMNNKKNILRISIAFGRADRTANRFAFSCELCGRVAVGRRVSLNFPFSPIHCALNE